MRVIGILAAYNEELVIAACLEHHIAQGIELYLIDNGSTDRTVAIARQFSGRGLVGIESVPRHDLFDLAALLARKQALAASLDADWFIHLDADEMRLAPGPEQNLVQAMAAAERAGYNALNFLEFTFVPTCEAPDHAHSRFRQTMRWYYPFLPKALHQVKAWKKQPQPVDLTSSFGHRVIFPDQFIYPLPFQMLHYQFLSAGHAVQKYAGRRHPPAALGQGSHGWREQLDPASIHLPSQAELHEIDAGGRLDFSQPRSTHILDPRPGRVSPPGPVAPLGEINLARLPARRLLKALLLKARGFSNRFVRVV